MRSRRPAFIAWVALVIGCPFPTPAAEAGPAAGDSITDDTAAPEDQALHGQLTNVTQRHPRFNAPYSGVNSLTPVGNTEETTDLTVYAGRRLWRGAELWVDAEVDQGFGFDKTVGLAGFSSGEAYKIGANAPYLRLPRLFVRQVVNLGGDVAETESAANQLRGRATADNLALTVGKFSVVDVFDANRYAHDPRSDFLNWSLVDAGTFDYAADAWGFTYGAAAALTLGAWTTRAGLFQLSRVPNGKIVAVDFSQYSGVLEVERRQTWFGREGSLKILGFANRASMGDYTDAVAAAAVTGAAPDTATVRRRRWRGGISVDVEQPLTEDVGVFARAGANDGHKEAYEFTEINRSASVGLSTAGGAWGRKSDAVGVAAVENRLSRAARSYFQAGGIGILIGDGRLNYAPEKILETYYAVHLPLAATLSFDYQHVTDPAYNRDRGPVSIYSVRLHIER
jgi:high affinity Mn2+ porin